MFCGTPEAISDIQRFKLQTPLEAFANNWDVFLHPWSILWDAICFAAPVKPVPITFPPDTLFAEILQTYSLHWVVMNCFRGVLWHPWGHFLSPFPLTTSVLHCIEYFLSFKLCCGTLGDTSHCGVFWDLEALSNCQGLLWPLGCVVAPLKQFLTSRGSGWLAAPPKPLLIFWVCCGTPEAFCKILCV